MNLDQIVDKVVLTKSFSVSADDDSSESKKMTLEETFEGCKLRDVFYAVLSPEVIKVQGKVRKAWNSFSDGQVIKVKFGVRASADPITTIVQLAAAAGMTVEQFIQAEMAKRSK